MTEIIIKPDAVIVGNPSDISFFDPRREQLGAAIDAIARLDTPECTADDVLLAINIHDRLKQLSKELGEKLEAGACKFIKANGDILCGTVRYYVGVDRKVKCKDVKGALEQLLQAAEGDMDRVAGCLSSDAWKPGACKDVLGEKQWGEVFEVSSDDKLKEGAAPKQSGLKKIDSRFLPKKAK